MEAFAQLPAASSQFDAGLLRETLALLDESLVVNGLDASDPTDKMVRTLQAGRVNADMWTSNWFSLSAYEHQFMQEHADDLVHVTTVREIREAAAEGKVAIVYGQQDVEIDEDLSKLAGLYQMGLRSSGLVYNTDDYIGSGCVDPNPGPLSYFGLEVVERLQDLGVVISIGGHCSEATGWDVLDVAEGPIVNTHTNVRALRDNPRNMTDDLMRGIADTGGVIGVSAYNFFFVKKGRATLDLFLDHIDHMVDVVGIDHVGLGLDQLVGSTYSGPVPDSIRWPPEAYPPSYDDWIYVEGLEDHSGIPLIAAGLKERGYDDDGVKKIMGENWLRVWEEVWGE